MKKEEKKSETELHTSVIDPKNNLDNLSKNININAQIASSANSDLISKYSSIVYKDLANLNLIQARTATSMGIFERMAKLHSNYGIFNDEDNILNKNIFDKTLDLNEDLSSLKRKLSDTVKKYEDTNSDKLKLNEELEKLKEEIKNKEGISHILPRICLKAQENLLTSEKFKNLFEDGRNCECVVVSIDIRRSTELMLKARTPKQFSLFITTLSKLLSMAIIENYGIFDKFTGDGILAFFPKFYSGEKAILRAIKAVNQCHEIFNDHYNDSRGCFNVFIKDIGLGIGIDFGEVTLVNTSSELTVVGIPVVYACRLSGAKAGDTLLNQPALEELNLHCKNLIKIEETEIDIKNEGIALAYKVTMNDSVLDSEPPVWEV